MSQDKVNDKWWLEPEETLWKDAQAVATTIETRQFPRMRANMRWLRLYGNWHGPAMAGVTSVRMMPIASYAARAQRFTYNVTQACVEAATAKIAKSRPIPQIYTSRASWRQQNKAKTLSKYIKGLFNQLDVYTMAQTAFKDCTIFGTGAVKVYASDGQIMVTRVPMNNLVIDDEEAWNGSPMSIHQRDYVDRGKLIALFPKQADLIKTAASEFPGDGYSPTSQHMVAVTESWRLPACKDPKSADDKGTHAVSLSNCTLVKEEYKHQFFPFAFVKWITLPFGLHGMGIPEQLLTLQVDINRICVLIQESIARVAKPNFFIPVNSQIIPQQISDHVGVAIKFQGSQIPVPVVPQAQSDEVYRWLENQYAKAFQITGISQLTAQSQKPSGLNSGEAIRTFVDVETTRFELQGQQYDKFFCEIAKRMIAMSRDLVLDGKTPKSKHLDARFMDQINWKDADIAEDSYQMAMYSINGLPDQPAGRIETVMDLVHAGWVDKDYGMELLGYPDVEDYIDLQTEHLECAKWVVDNAMWEGKRVTVTPKMDFVLTQRLARAAYLRSLQMKDIPSKNQEMLIKLDDDCQDLIDRAKAEMAAQQAPPEGPQPTGQPMPPPTAELLPTLPKKPR